MVRYCYLVVPELTLDWLEKMTAQARNACGDEAVVRIGQGKDGHWRFYASTDAADADDMIARMLTSAGEKA